MIVRAPITTTLDGVRFDALLLRDQDASTPGPTVMVFHDWAGRSQSQERFGEALVALGYGAICIDLYGFGRHGADAAERQALMAPLVDDRALLRRRLLHLTAALADHPRVDAGRLAAIGFCFGGLCVLDLARAGAPVRAVASFHGLFTSTGLADTPRIEARVAAFHGWRDPMVPPAAVAALGEELDAAGADWQLHAFGRAAHGFMEPAANDPENGVAYSQSTAKRAWPILANFLAESLAG